MVTKSYIQRNLRRINRLYNVPCSPEEALLLSKLATLELCGWIEVSMDDIVIRMAKRLLSDPVDRATYESEFVNRVHGFDYQIHFRRLLMGLIGLQGVVLMEGGVDPSLFAPMRGALSSLKPLRDSHAHTYLKGSTLKLDAPSVSLARFSVLYAGLKNVETVLRTFK